MIKFENTVTPSPAQWEAVIMGARNPMNSWDKSDSYDAVDCGACVIVDQDDHCEPAKHRAECEKHRCYNIGPKDHDLLMRLCKAGTDHRKFMRMLPVMVTITAPLYWWSEYDTYKIGTVANSCSKMHKLLSKPFEMNDFSFDKLLGYKNEIKIFVPEIDEEKEEWKPTVEDEFYFVSNQGRIKHENRMLSGSKQKQGYIRVKIRGKSYPIHRIVAEAFIENKNNKPFVNHIDGNKQNNHADNLEWCTQKENTKHARENNLQLKTVNTYKGKFTQEQRDEIKRLWDEEGISKREIAKKYSVSHTCINDIISDKYKYANNINVFEKVARPIVDTLNELRDSYFNEENEENKKKIWYTIIQLLPSSYNQKRTVMLNYEVLANIYKSRKNHKLDEWAKGFIDWIKTLPYSELITGIDPSKKEGE